MCPFYLAFSDANRWPSLADVVVAKNIIHARVYINVHFNPVTQAIKCWQTLKILTYIQEPPRNNALSSAREAYGQNESYWNFLWRGRCDYFEMREFVVILPYINCLPWSFPLWLFIDNGILLKSPFRDVKLFWKILTWKWGSTLIRGPRERGKVFHSNGCSLYYAKYVGQYV